MSSLQHERDLAYLDEKTIRSIVHMQVLYDEMGIPSPAI